MPSRPITCLLLGAAIASCAESSLAVPNLDRGRTPPGPALPVYGLARPDGARPCGASAFRGFDFWLGDWEVFDNTAPGTRVGWNEVTSEVSGCAVEEHWTDVQGTRGRSLNTYDAGTGRWHQLWMDATGGPVVITGSAGVRAMVMEGDSPQPSRITWTGQSVARVRQLWEISQDGRQSWQVVFDGDYQRRDRIEPPPEVSPGFCDADARPRFHWFDFLVGEWQIHRESASGPSLGGLSVGKDLSGCLLESRFRSAGGYQGKAFAALDFRSRTWNRTWIDEDGVRVALNGAQVGAGMVMSGERRLKSGVTQTIRVSWTPLSPDLVSEQWELSTDAGATWSVAWSFYLTRMP